VVFFFLKNGNIFRTEKQYAELVFPMKYEEFKNTEFFVKYDTLLRHENTKRFLNDDLRLSFDADNKPSHQLHAYIFDVYELGISIIDSNTDLSELYSLALRDEVVALSNVGNVDGIVDSIAEKQGRAYVYGSANEPMQFLMEKLNKDNINLLKDVLNVNDNTRRRGEMLSKRLFPSENKNTNNVVEVVTEAAFLKHVFYSTAAIDVRLGLHQFDTRFSDEAFNAAKITKDRLRIKLGEEHVERRKRLDRMIEMANSFN